MKLLKQISASFILGALSLSTLAADKTTHLNLTIESALVSEHLMHVSGEISENQSVYGNDVSNNKDEDNTARYSVNITKYQDLGSSLLLKYRIKDGEKYVTSTSSVPKNHRFELTNYTVDGEKKYVYILLSDI